MSSYWRIQLLWELELCFMDDRYLRSSATAVSVGHRREIDDGLLPMAHDKCCSSSVANTTATEPSDQVARLAVGGSPHLASAVALLFSGGRDRFFSWARSVWSSWSVSGRPRDALAAGGLVVPLGPPWCPQPLPGASTHAWLRRQHQVGIGRGDRPCSQLSVSLEVFSASR